jgi:hypothetical protein
MASAAPVPVVGDQAPDARLAQTVANSAFWRGIVNKLSTECKIYLARITLASLEKRDKFEFVAALHHDNPSEGQKRLSIFVSEGLCSFAGPEGADLPNTITAALATHRMKHRLARSAVSENLTFEALSTALQVELARCAIDVAIHNRKGRFPYRGTTTDAFRSAIAWWPEGLPYINPDAMDIVQRSTAFKVTIASNPGAAAEVIKKWEDSHDDPYMAEQVAFLIRRAAGTPNPTTYSPSESMALFAWRTYLAVLPSNHLWRLIAQTSLSLCLLGRPPFWGRESSLVTFLQCFHGWMAQSACRRRAR